MKKMIFTLVLLSLTSVGQAFAAEPLALQPDECERLTLVIEQIDLILSPANKRPVTHIARVALEHTRIDKQRELVELGCE